MELVSIVVPTYNAEKTIEGAIMSLLKQTYSDIEIIVVNDGSKDKTHEICLLLEEKDSRIKYLLIDNGGVSNARNTGICYARGTYIAFMDSDDCMEDTMIEKMVAEMREDIDCVCCGYKIVNQKGKVLFSNNPEPGESNKKRVYLEIEKLQNCQCFNVLWNKLFRLSVISEKEIAMDTSISMGEDFLFVLDYLTNMQGGIHVLSTPMYKYTLSLNGLQATYKDEINLRISQLERLKKFYLNEKFPLAGFYLEELRTIYIMMMENIDSLEKMEKVISSSICDEVCNNDIKCSGKYKVFLSLIGTRNIYFMYIAIQAFKAFKKISGKSYKW